MSIGRAGNYTRNRRTVQLKGFEEKSRPMSRLSSLLRFIRTWIRELTNAGKNEKKRSKGRR